MKYNKLAASLFFAGILLLSGCGSDDKENSAPPPAAEEVAETTPPASTSPILDSTTVTTTDGVRIKVNQTADGLIVEGQEGKIVLFEIYGSGCGYCTAAIAGYNRLLAKYPNDVFILTLETAGQFGGLSRAALQQYAVQNNMQYDTVASADAGKLFSFFDSLPGASSNQGVPVLAVLARDGSMVRYYPAMPFPEAEVDSLIQSLL